MYDYIKIIDNSIIQIGIYNNNLDAFLSFIVSVMFMMLMIRLSCDMEVKQRKKIKKTCNGDFIPYKRERDSNFYKSRSNSWLAWFGMFSLVFYGVLTTLLGYATHLLVQLKLENMMLDMKMCYLVNQCQLVDI